MNKRILAAIVIALALIIVGVIVVPRVVGDEAAPRTATPSPRPRPTIADVDAAHAEATIDAAPMRGLTVTDTVGDVEVQVADGAWRKVHTGEILAATDVIRTGPDATASIQVGSAATVQLLGGSKFGVGDISRTVAGVRLEGGRMTARVNADDGSTFRVEVNGSDAIAESTGGEFNVISDGRGRVAVASTQGRVKLSARGASVDVGEGEQSVIAPQAAPTAPSQIPPSLFLKVGRPTQLVQRAKQLTVVGQTVPGAIVSINGVQVEVGADGNFSTKVALAEGANPITVQAVDVMGRRQQDQTRVTVDNSKPVVKTGVTWEGAP